MLGRAVILKGVQLRTRCSADLQRPSAQPARGAILLKAAALLEARADEVARDLTLEEGKTFGEARGETLRAVAIFRYFAGQTSEPSGETYPSANPATFLYTARVPVGVV